MNKGKYECAISRIKCSKQCTWDDFKYCNLLKKVRMREMMKIEVQVKTHRKMKNEVFRKKETISKVPILFFKGKCIN